MRARHLLALGQIQRDRIFPLNSGSSVRAYPRGPTETLDLVASVGKCLVQQPPRPGYGESVRERHLAVGDRHKYESGNRDSLGLLWRRLDRATIHDHLIADSTRSRSRSNRVVAPPS